MGSGAEDFRARETTRAIAGSLRGRLWAVSVLGGFPRFTVGARFVSCVRCSAVSYNLLVGFSSALLGELETWAFLGLLRLRLLRFSCVVLLFLFLLSAVQ